MGVFTPNLQHISSSAGLGCQKFHLNRIQCLQSVAWQSQIVTVVSFHWGRWVQQQRSTYSHPSFASPWSDCCHVFIMQVCLWQRHVGAPFRWRSCGLLATWFQFGPLGKTPDQSRSLVMEIGKSWYSRHPYPWWRVWILQGRRIFRVVLELNFLHWRIHQGRSHESFPHRCDSWKMDEKISCYSPCLRFCVLWFFTIVPIIWPEIEKTVYTLPHFSLPRNHRFETRCTNASQNWLHGQWILQAKANGLTMGSKGKHSVQGQLASNKRAKNWPRGGGFPVPTCYKTFLCCFPRNAMAHLMWEFMVSLVKYLPWWFTMGDSFYPDQTCLQFCGLVADLRACYISFKADLKTRHQMHNLQRWYKCNLFLC